MKSVLNITCSGLILVFMTNCATQNRVETPQTRNVIFEMKPDGTKVELRDPKTDALMAECTTPCTLEYSLSSPPDYLLSYPGKSDTRESLSQQYVNKYGQYTPPLLLTKKPVFIGDMTIQGEMLTAAEKAKLKTQREQKTAAYKAKKQKEKEQFKAAEAGDYSFLNERKPTKCLPGQVTDDFSKVKIAKRGSPITSAKAVNKSGHCKIQFNVNTVGEPVELNVTSCSDDVFKNSSLFAASQSTYEPLIENGIAVDICGAKQTFTFKSVDKFGNIRPE